MNLFDTMRQAGGGEVFKTYASLYGLTEEQARKAVEAFMPAFSLGLKQNAADPLGLAEMMRRFAAGDYRSFFHDPEKAPDAGSDLLAFMLGSQDIVRKVAEQASLATGIAAETLKTMMPAVAATMMGGIQKMAAENPFVAAMRTASQTPASGSAGGPSGAKGPLDRHEEDEAAQEAEAPHLKAQRAMADAGLGMMRAGAEAWTQAAATMAAQAKGEAGGGGASNPFADLLEPGSTLSEAYRRNIEAILGAGKRKR